MRIKTMLLNTNKINPKGKDVEQKIIKASQWRHTKFKMATFIVHTSILQQDIYRCWTIVIQVSQLNNPNTTRILSMISKLAAKVIIQTQQLSKSSPLTTQHEVNPVVWHTEWIIEPGNQYWCPFRSSPLTQLWPTYTFYSHPGNRAMQYVHNTMPIWHISAYQPGNQCFILVINDATILLMRVNCMTYTTCHHQPILTVTRVYIHMLHTEISLVNSINMMITYILVEKCIQHMYFCFFLYKQQFNLVTF